jgi:hypothetical protein
MRSAPALLLALLAAACAPAPRPAPPPPPARVVASPPPPAPIAPDWRDWPVTPGTWRYARDERGSVAMFGRVAADALAVLRCDRAGGRVFLSVPGATPASLTVRTSSVARTLPLGATGGTPAYLAATLTPADPLLDAMAFSRGRFALSMAGAPPLVLPAWAEVSRVVEDCRP